MKKFLDRYSKKIRGVLSCFDRVVIYGTIPGICYAAGMTQKLSSLGIRIFDYTKFVEPFRVKIRENAQRLATENGLEIDFLPPRIRKEARVQEILRERGDHPGLVHIISAMESCTAFRPWHDKKTGGTYLKLRTGKCLHYYFYIIVEGLGLCYVRVPTWAPFRLQFYFNGHNLLAAALKREGIDFKMLDNSFLEIDDFERAQALADEVRIDDLHSHLNLLAREFCPVIDEFDSEYHWSLMQVEYATDIVFRRRADLQPLYQALTRTAIHAVKPDHIATFLGRKLTPQYQGELGNDFHTRIEGTRIKHHMGRTSIKMYDKRGIVLRVETTANDVSFFKHYRKVEHRDGTSEMKNAPVKKTIYSLPVLADLMGASNRRYLEFLAAIDDPTPGLRRMEKISKPAHAGNRSYRGFNLFDGADLSLFEAVIRGEFTIYGFQNRDVRKLFPGKSSGQVGRMLKRLLSHKLIKKVRNTYKYYLTKLGQRIITAVLKLREFHIVPSLAVC